MQSISQGSLKLEAYHDKITNQKANKTKFHFLMKELDFLRELKEEAECLQGTAKKYQHPQLALLKAQETVANITHLLEQEVVRTRRETALLQAQHSNRFEDRVQTEYESSALRIGQRLQMVEAEVQKTEESRKSHLAVPQNKFVNLKEKAVFLLMQKNVATTEAIKKQIKRRLLVGGLLKQRQKQREQHPIFVALKRGMPRRCYHFLQQHSRYYRNKSTERGYLQPEQSNYVRKMIEGKPKKSQIFLKTKYSVTNMNYGVLLPFQDQIYEEELARTKKESAEMQLKIDLLKNAIARRQSQETFALLQKEKDIQTEEAKAREFLAYLQMQSSFKDKLQSYSYRWAQTADITSHCNRNISKEWSEEPSNSFGVYLGVVRPRSRSVGLRSDQFQWDSSSWKSYQKTNTSLQRF